MNMITSPSQKTQSLGIIPHGTACISPSYIFSPVAGNSQTIGNVSLKGEKGKGTRKTAKFFLEVCNLFRKQAGHPPLECIFFNPAKPERFHEQKGEKFAFIHYGEDVPKLIEEHSEGGYLVSPELEPIIESKVNTARAGQILSDPEKRKGAIREFLVIKRMNRIVIRQKLEDAVVRSIIPTGVIESSGYEDTEEAVGNLLKEYKDKGIVIQNNRGTGGQGTAIFKPEDIKGILDNPDSNILKIMIKKMGYKINDTMDFKELFLKGMKPNHFSWQEIVSGQEVCTLFRTNSEKKQIEMPAVSMMFADPKEGHLGNLVVETEKLDTIAGFKLSEEQEKYFTLSIELMLHIKLGLNKDDIKKDEKGINAIYDPNGLHLKAFASDVFLSVAEDGSIQHKISEFNARPTPSGYAIASAEAMGVFSPFMRLSIPKIPMSKDMFEHLQELGVEKASEFFLKKFTPILGKFEGAFMDTYVVEDHSRQKNEEDHFSYSWYVFFPKPNMENKGKDELEAMKEIHEICKKITTHDIHETLDSNETLRPNKRLKTT